MKTLENKLLATKRRALKFGFSLGLIKKKKKKNFIRWGIIGLGNMAEVFSHTIDFSSNSKVVAVASRSLEKALRFSKKHGNCMAFGSYEELFEYGRSNIDIIYIATPLSTHYELIKKAILCNINVLCEKPITDSSSKLKELIELAKEKKVFLMEGMWMKCLPTLLEAKRMIKNDEIGEIEMIKVDFNKMVKFNQTKSIIFENEFGGVLFDYGIYAISFLHFFLDGKPDNIKYVNRKSEGGIDKDWSIHVKKDEKIGVINMSSNFFSDSKAVIIGAKGILLFESQFNRTNILKVYNREGIIIRSEKFKYENYGYEFQLNEVYNCLTNNLLESERISLTDSYETLQIMEELRF